MNITDLIQAYDTYFGDEPLDPNKLTDEQIDEIIGLETDVSKAMDSLILAKKTYGSWLKANHVEVITSGFTIGADAIKVIPAHKGTHFLRNCFNKGTETHSHTGITNHIDHAKRYAKKGCLGISCCMRCGVRNTWIMLAIIVHKKTKGNASSTILTNIIANELIICLFFYELQILHVCICSFFRFTSVLDDMPYFLRTALAPAGLWQYSSTTCFLNSGE